MGVQIDLVIFLSNSIIHVQKRAPLKPNIELVPTWSIGMQSMLQWVESKAPSVMHHVDQNHMDIIPYGWMDDMESRKKNQKQPRSLLFASVTFPTVSPCGWHVVVTY